MSERLSSYLTSWALSDPHPLAQTPTSDVFTVSYAGTTAVLKLLKPYGVEERSGAEALRHFDGHGAIRLLRSDEWGQLLEYAGGDSLVTLVDRGEDTASTQIIADVLRQLHSIPLHGAGEGLLRLDRRFRALSKKAQADRRAGVESIYARGATVAAELLADPREVRVLHGDIHHANIRQSPRGWLAFDPKGIVGERTYDCANTLCNPFRGTPRRDPLVHNEARLLGNAEILAQELRIALDRILAYTFAYACLSATWSLNIGDGDAAAWALATAEIVAPHLRL